MALFKIFKGQESNLPTKLNEGYCYVADDDQSHYFFYVDVNDTYRAKLAASYAESYPVKIVNWSSDQLLP